MRPCLSNVKTRLRRVQHQLPGKSAPMAGTVTGDVTNRLHDGARARTFAHRLRPWTRTQASKNSVPYRDFNPRVAGSTPARRTNRRSDGSACPLIAVAGHRFWLDPRAPARSEFLRSSALPGRRPPSVSRRSRTKATSERRESPTPWPNERSPTYSPCCALRPESVMTRSWPSDFECRGITYADGASSSGWDAGGRDVPSDAGSCGKLFPKSLGFLGDC